MAEISVIAVGLNALRGLLPDRERVPGPDHPNTLATRASIAYLAGRCGNPKEALRRVHSRGTAGLCRFLLNLVRGRWRPGTGLAEARLTWLSGFAWFVVTRGRAGL